MDAGELTILREASAWWLEGLRFGLLPGSARQQLREMGGTRPGLGWTAVKGRLELTPDELTFTPDEAWLELVARIVGDAFAIEAVATRVVALDAVVRVGVKRRWFLVDLAVWGPHGRELFAVDTARDWRRAIESAAGLAPDEALSRARPGAREASLSNSEEGTGDG